MASPTRKVKRQRKLRRWAAGKSRKAADRNLGSTRADLPLNKPNANELAQKKKK